MQESTMKKRPLPASVRWSAWLGGGWVSGSLDDGRSSVWTTGIDGDSPLARDDHQIHVCKGQSAEKHLIAQHQRTAKADAVLEAQLYRSDVGHRATAAVGDSYTLAILLLEVQSLGYAGGQTKMYRASVC